MRAVTVLLIDAPLALVRSLTEFAVSLICGTGLFDKRVSSC